MVAKFWWWVHSYCVCKLFCCLNIKKCKRSVISPALINVSWLELSLNSTYFKCVFAYSDMKKKVKFKSHSHEMWVFWPFDNGPWGSLHSAEQFHRSLLPHGVGPQGNQEVWHLGDFLQQLHPLGHHVLNLERVSCVKWMYIAQWHISSTLAPFSIML